jgi:hypothetical protein
VQISRDNVWCSARLSVHSTIEWCWRYAPLTLLSVSLNFFARTNSLTHSRQLLLRWHWRHGVWISVLGNLATLATECIWLQAPA